MPRSVDPPGTTSGADSRPTAQGGPLASALDRVGDRWSLLLVEALLDGPLRFSDLLERVPGLAPNILSDRLRRLRRVGILVARPYSQRPIRMAYALTADARDLAGALRLLADWGARGAGSESGPYEPLRHAACGTPLETRSYCPTCTVVVDDPEAGEDRLV